MSEYGSDAMISGSVTVTGSATFNEQGYSESDFRIESDNDTHMLFVDAGNDKIGIGTSSPSHKFDINGDIRIRGNDIRDSSGNPAISFDGSANTEINGSLTVATSDLPLQVTRETSRTNDGPADVPILQLSHKTTSTAAGGFGSYLGFVCENAAGNDIPAGGMAWGWTDASAGSETSFLGFAYTANGSYMPSMNLNAFGLTVNSSLYGALTTDAGTSGITIRTNRHADYAGLFVNDGDNQYRYGLRIQCGSDGSNDGVGTRVMSFADGDGTEQGYISFSGGTVTYAAFTGVHDASVLASDYSRGQDTYAYGTIVKIVSTASPRPKQVEYTVEATSQSKDKAAFGVYSQNLDPNEELGQNKNHQIFSLGDGHVLVCSEGGNIDIGDYICSSNTVGHGMKQDDDLLHNYTVAKATEAVDWSQESQSIKLISCTYHAS